MRFSIAGFSRGPLIAGIARRELGIRLVTFLAVFSLCGLIPSRLPGQESTPSIDFYFVQMTDTHIGVSSNLLRTEKVVEAINALPQKLEFVAHTGDLFYNTIGDENTLRSSLAALKNLKAPLYVAPGNHDILATNLLPTLKLFTNHFGPLSFVQEHRGVRVVFFYSETLREGTAVDGYQPLVWLQSALDAGQQKPVLIFHHAPFALNIYSKENTLQWHQLIGQHPVKAVITGHTHAAGLVWAGETPVFIAPPVADLFGRQAAFRVYRYNEGKLSYSTKYVE